MLSEVYFEVMTGIDNKGNSYYLIPFDFENFKVNPYYYSSPLKEDPFLYNFDKSYRVKIKENTLKADFYLLSNLGSEFFIQLLNEFNIVHKAIPLDISLYRNKEPQKKYYLIFISDVISILNENLSIFKLMQDKYTGNTIIENGFKKYDEITQFIIDKEKVCGHHLFYCSETNRLVCSSKFKDSFMQYNLTGIDFKEINSEYKYYSIDPALMKFL